MLKPERKTVTSPSGETYSLPCLGMHGYACCGCGKPLGPESHVTACPDCGGIFCEDCIANGTFESHTCEPDDIEESEA